MCEHCGCRGVEPIAELMDEHLELGIFPVAVVTLGAAGWDTVARAHAHPHSHAS